MEELFKALATEFLGTFTLVFIGASATSLIASQTSSILAAALAFGLTLAALIYAWGGLSKAHFNPAVSLGSALSGGDDALSPAHLVGYWIAQLLGGIAAAAFATYVLDGSKGIDSFGSYTKSNSFKALVIEAVLTFFLVITFLFLSKGNKAMSATLGLAVGGVLSASMLAAYPFTGASLNPARSLGPSFFTGTLSTVWVYLVGPLIGSIIAAVVYRIFQYTSKKTA